MPVAHDEDRRRQALIQAEEQRCQALVEGDIPTLERLLAPDLTHTHTRGNTETRELFLSLLQGPMKYHSIERQDLTVRLYDRVGVMEGIALTKGSLGGGEPISIRVRVLQVWVETEAGWQMSAFQGTIIG